jgi:hypothetical protein
MPTRRLRWVRDEVPFVVVIAILVSSVVYLTIWPDHWRRGVGLIALSTLLGGVLRLVLPATKAGALAVRSRWWDVVCYLSLSVGILAVALRLH